MTKIDTITTEASQCDWSSLTAEQISQKEQRLESLKQTIETLSKNQHIEILKILKKHAGVKVNENRNGVYINLSYVAEEVVEDIAKYLDYIKEQELNLAQFEMKKEECRNLLDD
jgi:hypothetical protein